jgi:hypothetical protein
MRIVNLTRKSLLVRKAEIAASPWSKTKGLMFRSALAEGEGLLMEFGGETKPAIWMPFMRFALDLVFIGADRRIVEVMENVRPISRNPGTWKVYVPRKCCRWVLETKAGRIKATGTRIGDLLEF